ncbi:MAG TPA: hypothetical protein VLB12_03200 [Gemmatimonadales bacterium]|nr:hypothetical protein [Gemmatimonadales bacterium]
MVTDKLISVERLIEEAGLDRRTAYSFYPLPFAHVIDGELYYEPEPLKYWCRGATATSAEEYHRSFRLMRETTAGSWEEAMRRADAGGREAARVAAARGRRRKRSSRASTKAGNAMPQVTRQAGKVTG